MEIQIKSIKIKDDYPVIVYSQLVDGNKTGKLTFEDGSKAHQDFIKTLPPLAAHYAILTGYIKPGPIKDITKLDDPILADFHISGFHISGDDEDESIIITGHRIVPESGKAVILNSPLRRFNEDDKTRYKFMDELLLAVAYAKEEAIEYIGGKVYKEPQMQLELKDPDEETK